MDNLCLVREEKIRRRFAYSYVLSKISNIVSQIVDVLGVSKSIDHSTESIEPLDSPERLIAVRNGLALRVSSRSGKVVSDVFEALG